MTELAGGPVLVTNSQLDLAEDTANLRSGSRRPPRGIARGDTVKRLILGHGERGQATVEFAFILPVILLVIVGLIAFGKAFNYWLNLNHLANEGARWAVVDKIPPYTCSTSSSATGITTPSALDIEKYLYCQLPNVDLQNKVGNPASSQANYALCFPAGGTPAIGDPASVKIKSPYTIGFGKFSITFTLVGKSTMRLEQIPSWAQQGGAGCP